MKKYTIAFIALIAFMLLVVGSIEWLKEKEQKGTEIDVAVETEAATDAEAGAGAKTGAKAGAEAGAGPEAGAEVENSIYGMTLSFANEQQRVFTWLSDERYEQSGLQIKKEAESWQQGSTVLLEAKLASYSNENGQQLYSYTATLDQLEEQQTYTYRVVAADKVISQEYSFTTYGEQEESFQFIHVTDSQGVTEADYTQWGITLRQAQLAAPQARFIVHGGDLTDDPAKEQEWKWFYSKAEALTSVPFFPTTGNHELVDDDASSYAIRFRMPDNGASALSEQTTYYMSYQNLLLISMNTEETIDEQTIWLQDVLEQHADSYDWIVVSMHRGVYGASRFKKAEDWTKLFDEYGVDLVLQGHNHSYSRSYPLVKGEAAAGNEQGTVYVTLNAAGSKLNDKKKEKAYQAVAFQNGKQMYAIVDVSSKELTYSAYDVDGQLLDQFTLESS